MLPLSSQTIAIAEGRQGDLLAGMLERAGAQVRACPMLSIHDAPDQAPVEAWLRALCGGGMDEVIFYTGEGVKRLLAAAQRLGLEAQTVEALGKARRVVRGNKPVRELQAHDLRDNLVAEPATTDGLIALLEPMELRGHRVGLQLFGTDPAVRLTEFLAGKGAVALPVAPYVYAGAADDAQVVCLIRALAGEAPGDKVDAIAFTSASQWNRLKEVAQSQGLADLLRRGMAQTCVAAVGPNVQEKLQADGIRVDCLPADETWFMNALVRALGKK